MDNRYVSVGCRSWAYCKDQRRGLGHLIVFVVRESTTSHTYVVFYSNSIVNFYALLEVASTQYNKTSFYSIAYNLQGKRTTK